jgi:hypothetical protein
MFPRWRFTKPEKGTDMMKVLFASAAAMTMMMAAPSASTATTQADGIKLAQIDLDVNVGHPRDHDRVIHDRVIREGHDRDVDVTVGRRVGPRNCRTVTTYVERGDRRIKRTERRCD